VLSLRETWLTRGCSCTPTSQHHTINEDGEPLDPTTQNVQTMGKGRSKNYEATTGLVRAPKGSWKQDLPPHLHTLIKNARTTSWFLKMGKKRISDDLSFMETQLTTWGTGRSKHNEATTSLVKTPKGSRYQDPLPPTPPHFDQKHTSH
jgi:hypothetical protein